MKDIKTETVWRSALVMVMVILPICLLLAWLVTEEVQNFRDWYTAIVRIG